MTDESSRVALRFDGWMLLREPLELLRNGERLRIQELPLQILELLGARPGKLVTRDELVAHLWPKGVVDFDAGINTAMRKLRAALGDDADAPRYIETVPRQGYRFIATLAEQPSAVPAAPSAPEPIPATRWRWPAFGSAAICAMLAGWALLSWRPAPEPEVQARRIAVLPFENLSPDPANAFFADGMHEEILSSLANVAHLEVISRTTMMQYRTSPRSVRQIADELGITHALEGSVRRENDLVRVTLQLIDARDDRHLWSRSYDRALGNAMTLQTEVAADVAAQLTNSLVQKGPRLPPPRNTEAYDLWLQGALAWQHVGGGGATIREINRIEAMYTRAIELDDQYAAAYADRCRVRIAKFASGNDQSEANIAGARSDLAMAQRLAGNTTHVLMRSANLAYLIDGDMPRALDFIQQAEKAGPLNADFLMSKANFLAFTGRQQESLAIHEAAARLDPGNPTIYRYWMINLFAAHKPEEALKVAREFDARIPGRIARGELLFQYTGSTRRWRADVDRARQGTDAAVMVSTEFELMRFENRIPDLQVLIANYDASGFQQHNLYRSLIGQGPKPVAQLRGWERFLSGDRAGAKAHGRSVLEYVESQPRHHWNEWALRVLAAEGWLFAGDASRAQSEARLALAAIGQAPNFAVNFYARTMSARIFAWTGAGDEAVALLEELVTRYPGVGPAVVTRDPFFTKPLADNPRFQSLASKLEAEILANQKLL
jgi:TolB-like protein/DNA-binding winged helix-turn-helix (wHTH) protein